MGEKAGSVLAAPSPARADTSVVITSRGGGERTIALPAREDRSRGEDDQQASAHLACPRERILGNAAGDDEE